MMELHFYLQRFLILHSNGFIAALMSIHTLIQAGCDPVPFVFALVVLTVCLIYLYMFERSSYLEVTTFTMSWCILMLGLGSGVFRIFMNFVYLMCDSV